MPGGDIETHRVNATEEGLILIRKEATFGDEERAGVFDTAGSRPQREKASP